MLGSLADFDRVLVLVHTRDGLHALTSALAQAGILVESIHGTKKQELRDRALREFNEGKLRVLVTTDAIARNLEFSGLQNVVSFDFPLTADVYHHYVQITQTGKMITLLTPKDRPRLAKIEAGSDAGIPRVKADGFAYETQPASVKPARKKGGKGKGLQTKPLQNKKAKFKTKRGRK